MTNEEKIKAQQIAALNDSFRVSNRGGMLVITSGIDAYSPSCQAEIFRIVHSFDAFTPDNDPHGEHDFGAFDYQGQKIFWKIDTYSDSRMEHGAEDHTSPSAYRVLTVMLASEY